jgi:sigma-B regulation protein RsbQ
VIESARSRLNVRISGQGSVPLVFAHGFGCDQTMWRFVAPAFEPDYRVISFDYAGHGGAATPSDPRKYGRLDAYASDVLEICRELEIEHGVFVGHSVSSIIGVLAANREPDRFDDLVMIGPSPRYINESGYIGGFERQDIEGLLDALASNYVAWSRTMAPVIMGRPDRPSLGEELTESFCRTDPAIATEFAKACFLSDNRLDLASVRQHCLVLQCSEDAIAPITVGRYVHQHLPDSEFVLLHATGHCPHLSAPDETIAAMRAFLQRRR